ncbi:hypothetical protein ACLESO_06710 [Pyxidicoccus sp. 3LG]
MPPGHPGSAPRPRQGPEPGLRLRDNKGQAKDETRQQLETACAQKAECRSGAGQHFESCFDENYTLGGRRRAGGLNTDGLVTCINGKVGKPLFSAHQE